MFSEISKNKIKFLHISTDHLYKNNIKFKKVLQKIKNKYIVIKKYLQKIRFYQKIKKLLLSELIFFLMVITKNCFTK